MRLDSIRGRELPHARFLRELPGSPVAGGISRPVTGIQAMRRGGLAKTGSPRSWPRSHALRSSPPP